MPPTIPHEYIQDIVGAMVTEDVQTGIAVTYDEDAGKLNFVVAGGGSFLGLSDTPDSYVGEGGKIVAVKVAEDGVEFVSEADPVFSAWLAGPPNVSEFTNDAGYLTAETDTLADVCDRGNYYDGGIYSTCFALNDLDDGNGLLIYLGELQTAERTLALKTNDKSFTLNIDGTTDDTITLQDWFDQSVKTGASPSFDGLTIGSAAEFVDYTLTFHGFNGDCVLTWFEEDGVFKIDQNTLTKMVGVVDTSGNLGLYFYCTDTLSNDVAINWNTHDKSFSIDMDGTGGDTISLQDWFDQGVKTTSTPQFLRVGVGDAASATSLLTVSAADAVCDNDWVAQISNLEATAGRNFGLAITAGSNANDGAFYVRNVGLEPLLYLYGSGLFVLYGVEGGDATFQLQADNGDDYPDYWRFSAYASGTLAIDNKSDAVTWVTRLSIGAGGDVSVGQNIITASTKYIGLGSSAGRLAFTNAGTDTVVFSDCYVGIGVTPTNLFEVAGTARFYNFEIGGGAYPYGFEITSSAECDFGIHVNATYSDANYNSAMWCSGTIKASTAVKRYWGIYIGDVDLGSGASITTSQYGLFIAEQTHGPTNYSIYVSGGRSYFGGAIGVGTPSAYADVTCGGNGRLCLAETTTPTANAGYGKIYTKTDDKLYFQDGSGVEHELVFA